MGRHASLRSVRYLALAKDYEHAARILYDNACPAGAPAFFHVVSHGIELTLKAVIAAGPDSDESLIALGHDLSFCLTLAHDRGLTLPVQASNVVEATIVALSPAHHAQAFRYPALFSLPLPSQDSALLALREMIAAASQLCCHSR